MTDDDIRDAGLGDPDVGGGCWRVAAGRSRGHRGHLVTEHVGNPARRCSVCPSMGHEPMGITTHIGAWLAGFASGTLATTLIDWPWTMASVALTGAIAAVITVAVHAGEHEGRPARADLHERVAGVFGDRAHAVSPLAGPLGVVVSAAWLVAEAALLCRAGRLRGL